MNPKTDYRFGFHLRPFNTISHIHLHCFVLPIRSFMINKTVYGWMLKSVEEVAKKVDRQINAKI